MLHCFNRLNEHTPEVQEELLLAVALAAELAVLRCYIADTLEGTPSAIEVTNKLSVPHGCGHK